MSTMKDHAQKVMAEKAAGAAAEHPASQDAGDLLERAAEAEGEREQATDEAVIAISYPTALTMKSFLPPGDATYLLRTMGGQQRGALHIPLGRIMGRVARTEAKETAWEGKTIPSIALHGQFRALVRASGQMMDSPTLFLSRGFAQAIANGLAEAQAGDPAATVAVDIDVGVESTGKPLQIYTWTVTHYLSGVAMRALRELQAPRRLARQQPQLAAD
jgi:hypothetical protein